MHITHLLKQPPVLLRSLAGLTTLPGVEARARDLEVRAYHLDGPGLPVCRDEGEDYAFSSEANRIAFFRRSCSI
jgi:hypothetical protein